MASTETAKTETAKTATGKNGAAKKATPKTATPWGPATVVEEVKAAQRVGEKRFASMFQLLENERGERLVRTAYTTGGVVRRGPVTLRPKDVERLRSALEDDSALAAALGWGGEP